MILFITTSSLCTQVLWENFSSTLDLKCEMSDCMTGYCLCNKRAKCTDFWHRLNWESNWGQKQGRIISSLSFTSGTHPSQNIPLPIRQRQTNRHEWDETIRNKKNITADKQTLNQNCPTPSHTRLRVFRDTSRSDQKELGDQENECRERGKRCVQ